MFSRQKPRCPREYLYDTNSWKVHRLKWKRQKHFIYTAKNLYVIFIKHVTEWAEHYERAHTHTLIKSVVYEKLWYFEIKTKPFCSRYILGSVCKQKWPVDIANGQIQWAKVKRICSATRHVPFLLSAYNDAVVCYGVSFAWIKLILRGLVWIWNHLVIFSPSKIS